MTRVFVDVAAAALDGGNVPSLDPVALPALRILAESGHEVVLVTGHAGAPPAKLAAVASDAVGSVPARPDDDAWYLTADVEHCVGASAHLRTVLVGSIPAPGSIHRCDAVARDLQAAVLEILAREAMPPVG